VCEPRRLAVHLITGCLLTVSEKFFSFFSRTFTRASESLLLQLLLAVRPACLPAGTLTTPWASNVLACCIHISSV